MKVCGANSWNVVSILLVKVISESWILQRIESTETKFSISHLDSLRPSESPDKYIYIYILNLAIVKRHQMVWTKLQWLSELGFITGSRKLWLIINISTAWGSSSPKKDISWEVDDSERVIIS